MSINRKNVVAAAGFGAVGAVALGFLSAGAANADTFIPLPGGAIERTLSDGTVVKVRLVDEWANITGSMGATPLHRNVFVGGTAIVDLVGDGAKGGIEPGYVVACQLTFGGEAGAGVEGTVPLNGDDASAAPSASGEFSIGPGEAKSVKVLDLESPDDYGNEDHSGRNSFSGKSGSVNWSDTTLSVSGCAGYAQARSYVKVKVSTKKTTGWVTLWGQPFSLG